MASFSLEEFLGDGALRGLIPKLLRAGWDDVPTIKLMNAEDKDWMTLQQKDALEIRSYLHDKSLMEYADRLEASGKSLIELLNTSSFVLSSSFDMKRGHIARFVDRASACRVSLSPSSKLPAGGKSTCNIIDKSDGDASTSADQSVTEPKIEEGYVFKGIIAAKPAEPRFCGFIQPPPVADGVAPYSAIENISVQKLAPEYREGMESLVTAKAPPMKASNLWSDRPAILLCVRRPGCIMCRAEAHQLYSRKPVLDVLGFQLIAVLHEQIESEVKQFWPRYWGGTVILDRGLEFFKALGGGVLLKDRFLTGFLLNPRAIANYKRAKATGLEQNFRGEGEIKGGMFIVGSGRRGIMYQFIERTFGDGAPVAEVIEMCKRMQPAVSTDGESK